MSLATFAKLADLARDEGAEISLTHNTRSGFRVRIDGEFYGVGFGADFEWAAKSAMAHFAREKSTYEAERAAEQAAPPEGRA